MSDRRFKMKGELTLTFDHFPTAIIAHTLLKSALEAIGSVRSMTMPPPDPNLDPGSPIPKGPFVVTISGGT